MVRAYNLAQAPAQNTAAIRSGSFGNSALGELAQQDQNILQKNLGNLSNTARMQDYTQQQNLYMQQQAANTSADQWNQGFTRQTGLDKVAQDQWNQQFQRSGDQWNLGFGRDVYNDAYGQNMQNLQTGIGLLGTLGGYNQNDLSTATGVQNAPMSYWSNFSNAANSMGQGYGTSTATQGTTSNPWLSAAGGAQLGQSAWSAWNKNGSTQQPAAGYSGTFQPAPMGETYA
jgi:hypothetical protein